MKIFLFLVIAIICSNCGTTQQVETMENNSNDIWLAPIKATIGKASATSDDFTINKVAIVQNVLRVTMTYKGGCGQHDFEAFGSAALAKSQPAVRNMTIIHKSNGDSCTEMLTRTINFNIEELAYQKEKGSEIYLTIDGWRERIKYVYYE